MDPDPQPGTTRAKEIGIHMGGEGPHQTLRKQAGAKAYDRLQARALRRSLALTLRDQAGLQAQDRLRQPFVVRWRSRSGTRDELRALTLRVRHAR